MKIVIIGPGAVGCGFVGQVARASGFEVVFVGRNAHVVARLNRTGRYRVHLTTGGNTQEIVVDQVTAVSTNEPERVASEIAGASLVATAVGARNLPAVAPLIAAGLRKRCGPINVLAFENLANPGPYLRDLVARHLPDNFPLARHGFSGALVSRVLSRKLTGDAEDEPLTFIGDAATSFVVDGMGIRFPLPTMSDMLIVDDFSAWTARKLCLFNAGHAVCAYLGSLRGYRFIHTAIQNPEIRATVLGAMAEAQRGLAACYGTALAGGESLLHRFVARFENPALNDSVERVGRDPCRKLGVQDRLVRAARLAEKAGIVPEKLAMGMAAALRFRDPIPPTDTDLPHEIESAGLQTVLSRVSGIGPGSSLGALVTRSWTQLGVINGRKPVSTKTTAGTQDTVKPSRIHGMKLCFMLVRRVPPVPSPILMDVFEILRRRGFWVDSGIAEELVAQPDALTVEHDLYLLKSHTELSLSLAGILHDQGARILNPYPSCSVTQDKIIGSRRLRAAEIPAPRSWVTGNLSNLAPQLEERALIAKPHRGHRGAGIHILHTPDCITAVPPPQSPLIVQEYIQGDGEDLKVYVVGEQVFATRKPFSPTSFTRPGRACPVSAEVRDIALRCGQVFGLGLYGLDLIEGPDGPVVVDVNYFPGYKGVPNAAALIADYISDYAHGRITLPGPSLRTPDVPADEQSVVPMFEPACAPVQKSASSQLVNRTMV